MESLDRGFDCNLPVHAHLYTAGGMAGPTFISQAGMDQSLRPTDDEQLDAHHDGELRCNPSQIPLSI